jgi:hypothetical protein
VIHTPGMPCSCSTRTGSEQMVVILADGKTLAAVSCAAVSVASLPKLPMPNSPNIATARGAVPGRRERRITNGRPVGGQRMRRRREARSVRPDIDPSGAAPRRRGTPTMSPRSRVARAYHSLLDVEVPVSAQRRWQETASATLANLVGEYLSRRPPQDRRDGGRPSKELGYNPMRPSAVSRSPTNLAVRQRRVRLGDDRWILFVCAVRAHSPRGCNGHPSG